MNKKNSSFSKEYKDTLEIYKKLHLNGTELDSAKNTFDGKSLKFFFQPIKQVIDLTKSNSIIDFGCGKAKYYFEEIAVKNNSYSNVTNYWNIEDVYLYDPGVKDFSKYDVLIDSDALVLLTDWKEFRIPDFEKMKTQLKTPVIFDGRNQYNTFDLEKKGFEYYQIGKK